METMKAVLVPKHPGTLPSLDYDQKLQVVETRK
jgi:hypothetical protein